MAFKKYSPLSIREDAQTVTVGMRWQMTFSRSCTDLIGDYEAVVFYYDESEKIICLQLSQDKTADAKKIRKSHAYCFLCFVDFFRAINYWHTTSKKYNVTKSEFEGQPCLLIDLKNPV